MSDHLSRNHFSGRGRIQSRIFWQPSVNLRFQIYSQKRGFGLTCLAPSLICSRAVIFNNSDLVGALSSRLVYQKIFQKRRPCLRWNWAAALSCRVSCLGWSSNVFDTARWQCSILHATVRAIGSFPVHQYTSRLGCYHNEATSQHYRKRLDLELNRIDIFRN
jgi:hypothetical protein